MRPRIPFVVAIIAFVVGCGETSKSPGTAGAPNGGGGAGLDGDSGRASGGSSGAKGGSAGLEGGGGNADSGAGSEATYAGAVLAMVTEHEATQTYVARAVFTTGLRPTIGGCSQCCCNTTDRGLPIAKKPPDASEITLLPAAGAPALATLVPEVFEDGHGKLHGMLALGWSWFAPLSDYAPVTSQPWNAGDILEVVAQGNEVAPFSGMLRAGPALGGVTPPIGSSPVLVDHTQPFEISWTPEGDGDAIVLLGIPSAAGVCYCDAPDSAGTLVVDADLLSPVSGGISLARLTVSTVTSSNASIDLVGAVVQTGAVEVQ
jgi:hypothetical protein